MLYVRDLKRLGQEVAAFPTQDALWSVLPGISNSAGHIVLHLEGNLREFIGRLLGGLEYTRDRPAEFAGPAVEMTELLTRVAWLTERIPSVVAGLTDERLQEVYPQDFMGKPLSVQGMLIHLDGHLQWHLGQIDYLRRVLTGAGAIPLASL